MRIYLEVPIPKSLENGIFIKLANIDTFPTYIIQDEKMANLYLIWKQTRENDVYNAYCFIESGTGITFSNLQGFRLYWFYWIALILVLLNCTDSCACHFTQKSLLNMIQLLRTNLHVWIKFGGCGYGLEQAPLMLTCTQ